MDIREGIKLVIFDFDGTLFHLEIDWATLKTNLEITPDGDESLGDRLQRYVIEEHPDLQKVTAAELQAVSGRTIDDEVAGVLEVLGERFRLAIVTRNSRQAVEAILAESKLKAQVYIIGREDVTYLKPDAEGIYRVLEHFACAPAQAVLVGDTSHDVEAAKAAHIKSVIVRNKQLLRRPKSANLYIDSLTELPGRLL